MPQKLPQLKNLDAPVKVLFTGYLCTVAIGYLFAIIQILFTHGMADGKFGLSVDDIVYSYYGNRSGTVLEQKLNGSMKDNAPEQERFKIMEWVRAGGDANDYKDDGIQKIVESRCIACHNKNSSLPNFTVFDGLKPYIMQDEGATFASLTRVSHVHMFGISFIFMFVGLIFSFSETTTAHHKCIAIGMPYIFLIADILSWWLTKLHPLFAWLVIFAGTGMGLSFLFMWLTSILEMWLFPSVYINGLGADYLRWRDDRAISVTDSLWLAIKKISNNLKGALIIGWFWLLLGGSFLLKSLVGQWQYLTKNRAACNNYVHDEDGDKFYDVYVDAFGYFFANAWLRCVAGISFFVMRWFK